MLLGRTVAVRKADGGWNRHYDVINDVPLSLYLTLMTWNVRYASIFHGCQPIRSENQHGAWDKHLYCSGSKLTGINNSNYFKLGVFGVHRYSFLPVAAICFRVPYCLNSKAFQSNHIFFKTLIMVMSPRTLWNRFQVLVVFQVGTNHLMIEFESPVHYAETQANRSAYIVPPIDRSGENGEKYRNFIRKMQSSFAWDWGPAFPTMGIW